MRAKRRKYRKNKLKEFNRNYLKLMAKTLGYVALYLVTIVGIALFINKAVQQQDHKVNLINTGQYVEPDFSDQTTTTKYGLAFSQFATTDAEQNVSITTVVFHESGEFIQYPALTLKPSKQRVVIDTEYVNGKRVNIYSNEITPQSIGSCITYGKRYSLSAIFGITSDKDDDGNEASGELAFLANHFSKLVETVDFGELEKKAEKFQKHAETLMRKIEKEIKEQA